MPEQRSSKNSVHRLLRSWGERVEAKGSIAVKQAEKENNNYKLFNVRS